MNNTISKIEKMEKVLDTWLYSKKYNYIECNHVPERFFVRNHKINVLLRTFFRLCPFNLRDMRLSPSGIYPITPQSNVALLKAYTIDHNEEIISLLLKRVFSLRSPKTKHFSLKQGIRIAINLYENSAEDPTPLNTVWFGEFLLDDSSEILPYQEKLNILHSIASYLIEELGYADHGNDGIYFYYGPTLKKVIYNASAIISSFLIRLGTTCNERRYIELGRRGIQFIINGQNNDGSWYYAAPPERASIDCFHQSYILQALSVVEKNLIPEVQSCMKNGISYYKNFFIKKDNYVIPIRYDRRFRPYNTWLFQRVDGRDIAEALVFFSVYQYDFEMVRGLVSFLYERFFKERKGYIIPEYFVYGANHIPYIEFQAWYLHALKIAKKQLILSQNEHNFCLS